MSCIITSTTLSTARWKSSGLTTMGCCFFWQAVSIRTRAIGMVFSFIDFRLLVFIGVHRSVDLVLDNFRDPIIYKGIDLCPIVVEYGQEIVFVAEFKDLQMPQRPLGKVQAQGTSKGESAPLFDQGPRKGIQSTVIGLDPEIITATKYLLLTVPVKVLHKKGRDGGHLKFVEEWDELKASALVSKISGFQGV